MGVACGLSARFSQLEPLSRQLQPCQRNNRHATHTAGINSNTTNNGKLNHTNLNHANALTTNQGKNLNSHVTPLNHAADPHNFGVRRAFANRAAFQPFWNDGWHNAWWHRNNFFHLGWIGPWFWPFAFGDVFYVALWPWDYWYYDPFWAYGYGDIYQAVFFPYGYEDYVQGPRAPERMAQLKQGIVAGCNEEAGEVTGWPIDQIQAALEPDQRQSQLLDDLGNAVVKASDEIRSHCQADIAFTPTGRLDQMHDRVASLVDSVNTVSPALSGFYDSLSDEQKARFNHIAPHASRRGQSPQRDLTTLNVKAQCDAGMMAWRPVRLKCRTRRRRGLRLSAAACKPCLRASRRCSPRLPASTTR